MYGNSWLYAFFLEKKAKHCLEAHTPREPRQTESDRLVGWMEKSQNTTRAYRQCQCTLSRILEPDPLIFDLNSGVFPVAVETYPYHDNASWIMYCDHVLGARFPDRGNMKAAAIILLGKAPKEFYFPLQQNKISFQGNKEFPTQD